MAEPINDANALWVGKYYETYVLSVYSVDNGTLKYIQGNPAPRLKSTFKALFLANLLTY